MNEKDNFYKHFAARLSKYLDMLGMSQTDLAKRMDVSDAAVSDWIHGRKMPRMPKIDQMSGIFGCARSDLIDPEKPDRSIEDDQIAFISNVAKSSDDARARLLAYAQKLKELMEMENPG